MSSLNCTDRSTNTPGVKLGKGKRSRNPTERRLPNSEIHKLVCPCSAAVCTQLLLNLYTYYLSSSRLPVSHTSYFLSTASYRLAAAPMPALVSMAVYPP